MKFYLYDQRVEFLGSECLWRLLWGVSAFVFLFSTILHWEFWILTSGWLYDLSQVPLETNTFRNNLFILWVVIESKLWLYFLFCCSYSPYFFYLFWFLTCWPLSELSRKWNHTTWHRRLKQTGWILTVLTYRRRRKHSHGS